MGLQEKEKTEKSLKETPRQQLPYEWGQLAWTSRAKETAGSIFLSGRYPAPIQALLEFTDNSFGYRNRVKERPTIVTVTVDRDKIGVLDYGGLGTDASGIKRFLRVGETEEMGIGYRGAGAKFAAWYLGMDIELSAKKQGEEIEYITEIPGFGDPHIEYSGTVPIKPTKSNFDKDKGRFEIKVRELKISDDLPQGSHIRRVLGEVYRPIITKEKIDLRSVHPVEKRTVVDREGNLQEINDKAVLFVTTSKKKEQVFPLEIPLLPEYSEDDIEVVETEKNEKLWFWAGEMDLGKPSSKNVKSGIRFYYDGRLINIDYCGFNERDPRLAGLVGEVHLDNIIGIKDQLSVNKSSGINTQSEQWQRVTKIMNKVLAPFIEDLLKKPIVLMEGTPRFLIEAMADARKLFDYSVRQMAEDKTLITYDDVFLMFGGETHGQRQPKEGNAEKEPRGGTHPGKKWPDQEGRTVPDVDIDPSIKRIRKSYIDRYEFGRLRDTSQASMIVKEKSENSDKESRTFVLNLNHPLVQTACVQGKLAVTEFVGMELIEHLAQEHSKVLENYLKFKREALMQFGKMLQSTPEYQMLIAKRPR